jgi:hypothetical protein
MHRALLLFLLLTALYTQALPLAKPLPSLNRSHLVDTTRKSKKPSFYIEYKCYWIGISVIVPLQPILVIEDSQFNYSNFRGSKMVETIREGHFRQSSIDSILSLIAPLTDSTIQKINPFVINGNTHLLTITSGTHSTKFKLSNSFNRTAFKIVTIINQYLPQNDRIWYTEELIKQEKESREWFDKYSEEDKKRDSIQAVRRDSL